ncbi:MAG TPA: trigger factor [Actinomycetes bacterium]
MKSAVETLTPTRVKLTVEVPFDELKPSLDAAYRRIAGQVNIPGFRKGKVPAAIIDQRVGRGAVLDEAVNEHLPKAYNAAAQEHGVKALGQPDVDVTDFADGEQLTFTAEVDIRPQIELPDYDGLEVTVDDAEVTDADVDEQLTSLAARFASLTLVERPVEDFDFVTIDLSATHDGHAVEDATASGMSYEVGSGTLLEGLDAAIVGLSAGESATFNDRLRAGDHADADVDVEVTVTAVKVRNMPDLDDDFAQLASEFDTLDELKDDLRRRLADYKKVQQGIQARDRALQKLLSLVEVPLPEALVQAQIESHFQDGHGDDEHHAEYDKQVREGLAAQFVLDDVAVKEELSVGEGELSEYIVANAQQYGMTPDQFAQEIVNAGQVPAVVGEVVRAKALAVILERATVTDESGNEVDLAALGVGVGVGAEPAEAIDEADDADDADEVESEGDDEG